MDLRESLTGLLKKNISTFEVATVVARTDTTCTLRLGSDVEVSIPLVLVDNNKKTGWLLKPKVGSQVKVLRTRDHIEITHYGALESASLELGNGKLEVKNEQQSLITLLAELLEILKEMKVSTPNGASGVPLPDTIKAITELKNKFYELLE